MGAFLDQFEKASSFKNQNMLEKKEMNSLYKRESIQQSSLQEKYKEKIELITNFVRSQLVVLKQY
ncbi:hypothetical protein TTHERM_001202191 (macronuclear) [Tetrahymena thermophila SB210]|uniref:Uncharacterized protein n=1 Tax=Tetrahymena thermophila (strain SB210) TaxID=312017 RepID=W7XLE9_TETTS|nr:hypothetical protein TTHERM_001202191 [Tetrahymena thermophila SB210]EWS76169.1 hypothetical protein TTHERM_001202191 [Tetrahymena thermophila SB210]|eukprot:XP_012651293.1 hypothetical protein TTHERM_001202191 [Tetrahymena thermophila SB210]